MGLDQYAYITDSQLHSNEIDNSTPEPDFYWRKHAKLQEFMEQLWVKKFPEQDLSDFNCGFLPLTPDDVSELEKLLQADALPESPGGFFYGHQFQDESAAEYRQSDLEFCEKAKEALSKGLYVYYSCWY